jgi:rare lipoprotein A
MRPATRLPAAARPGQGAQPLLVLSLALALVGCTPRGAPPTPHYVLGEPYRAGGVWRYPREQFDYADTGLAAMDGRGAGLTADGEAFDQGALAAAHRTLQLPALARVTDLENGREVLVRINDRGPDDPHLLIALTRRAVELLGAPAARPFRVRVQLIEAESRQLAGGLAPVAPLQVATAPKGAIATASLAPPPGAVASDRGRTAAALPEAPAAPAAAAAAQVPLRLPEQVWQGAPAPGRLYVECGSFSGLQYASIMQAQLVGLGARITTDYYAPREAAYRVRLGPFDDTASADAALDRALAAGVSDGRIIVDNP